jgi:hypothetical protein
MLHQTSLGLHIDDAANQWVWVAVKHTAQGVQCVAQQVVHAVPGVLPKAALKALPKAGGVVMSIPAAACHTEFLASDVASHFEVNALAFEYACLQSVGSPLVERIESLAYDFERNADGSIGMTWCEKAIIKLRQQWGKHVKAPLIAVEPDTQAVARYASVCTAQPGLMLDAGYHVAAGLALREVGL